MNPTPAMTPLGRLSSLLRPGLAGDVWGGLAAMLVALPSAIAFGVAIFSPLGGALAAQGAVAGLLGAVALGLMAPLFGGAPRLITAPCAPAAAVLSALAIVFTSEGVPAATVLLLLALIGLLAGGIQIAFGVARIGQLIKFIPYPVVSGYLSGVGLIIIGSQVPKFLGAPAGTRFTDALLTPSAWSWPAVVVGMAVIAAMLLTPRLTRAVPAAILALLAGVACYLLLGLADPALLRTENNPLLVGTLPRGEGSLTASLTQHWQALSGFGLDVVAKVFVPALTLAALLSIDTLKTCLVLDAMTNSRHDSNRELVGQGLGNIASALTGGIPGAGTMGATLINLSSGGKTRLSGLMAGLFSLFAYLLLAPLIAWVPVAALAAILIVVGFRMIDRHSLAFFYSPATRLDFLVILAVILVALFGNLIAASGVGVALAILLFIREQTKSSVVRNRIEGSELLVKRARSMQDIDRLEREGEQVVVFELQGSLFFGTASQLLTALEPEIEMRKYLILSMRRVQSLDITATHVLEQVKSRLEERNAYLVFCDIPKGLPSGLKMKRFLKETGVVRPTDKALTFATLDEALDWVDAQEQAAAGMAQADAVPMELRDMPLLAGCSDEAIAALEAVVELRTVKEGKKVFKAGMDSDELFLIRKGTVKIMVPLRKKEAYHLATSGPGSLIGGMAFIEAGRHAFEALVLRDTELYVLPRDRFEVLAVEHGDLALAIVGAVARNVSTRLHATITELQALRG